MREDVGWAFADVVEIFNSEENRREAEQRIWKMNFVESSHLMIWFDVCNDETECWKIDESDQ